MPKPLSKRPVGRRAVLVAAALVASPARVALADSADTVVRSEDARAVTVLVHQPAGRRCGTVLFSHGFGCSPRSYEALLRPWAADGFLVLAPLHRDAPDHPDYANFRMAETLSTRLLDMRAAQTLAGKGPHVAAGHSYGGLIALTLGGAAPIPTPGMAPPSRDPATVAAIAFSPPGPVAGLITEAGYASVDVPFLLETGDRDFPIVDGRTGDWHAHLSAFRAARSPARYALVLAGVDHFFGDLIGHLDRAVPPQRAGFAEALDVSRVFLAAYGRGEPASRAALAERRDLLRA